MLWAVAKPSKTPSKIPNRPGKHGGALLTGNPGNKGGGRPPNALRNFLATLRADPTFHDELEKAAKDRTDRGFAAALKLFGTTEPSGTARILTGM